MLTSSPPQPPLQPKFRVAFQCSLSRESLLSRMHFASIAREQEKACHALLY